MLKLIELYGSQHFLEDGFEDFEVFCGDRFKGFAFFVFRDTLLVRGRCSIVQVVISRCHCKTTGTLTRLG